MASADKNPNNSMNKDGKSVIKLPMTKPGAPIERITTKPQLMDMRNIVVTKSPNVNRIIRAPANAVASGSSSNVTEIKKVVPATTSISRSIQIVPNQTKQYTNTRLLNDNKSTLPVTSIITLPKTTASIIPPPKITIPEVAKVTLTPASGIGTKILSNINIIEVMEKKGNQSFPVKIVSKASPQVSQPSSSITSMPTLSTSVVGPHVVQKIPIVTKIPATVSNGSKWFTTKSDETVPVTSNNLGGQSITKLKPFTPSTDVKVIPIQAQPTTNSSAAAIKPSRNTKNYLEQEYAKFTPNPTLMPIEMQEALAEYYQWQKINDPDQKMSKAALDKKLREFIQINRGKQPNVIRKRYVLTKPLTTDELNKASTSLIENERKNDNLSTEDSSSDHSEPQIKKRFIEKISDASDETKSENGKSGRSVINIETLNANKGINVQISHGPLPSAENATTQVEPISPEPSYIDLTAASPEISAKKTSSSNGHSNVQILNGQLSNPEGPIKLMSKMESVLVSAAPGTSQASTSNSDVRSKTNDTMPKSNSSSDTSTIHQNLLNIFNQQNSKQTCEIRNRKVDQIKRGTRRARSLSLSGNRAQNPKFRQKNIEIARQMRAALNADEDEPIELDEKLMKTVLLPERRILGKSKQKIFAYQNPSEGNSWSSTPAPTPPPQSSGTSSVFVSELEKFVSWNNPNGSGKLPNSTIIFERNEFGMIEFKTAGEMFVRTEGRQSPKMYGKRSKKNYSDSNADKKGMACGHKDFNECFDEVIKRTEQSDYIVINGKKPYEYYSNEYKDLIRMAIQLEKGQCSQVTPLKIAETMMHSDSFKLPVASNEFNWLQFIEQYNNSEENGSDIKKITAAPLALFNNPFPCTFNRFVVGQKLEAIDPQNCGLFCVCTVVDKKGFRVKLHFDGYHNSYDFWVNADSKEIFPAGWCNKTARDLISPHKRLINNRSSSFDWNEYLASSKALPAPRSCFSHLNSASTIKNPFKIGMKLEADDIKFTRKICVATIGDVIDTRILVTFDGLDETSNYWADISSPYIHPVNWHFENGYSITPPSDVKTFSWSAYLRTNRAEAAPEHAFCTRKPADFTVGMAIEVVDKKNPSLVRPAVITMVDEYEIKVLFIGWPEKYAYWVDDDSPDIHPINWAKKTCHPIEQPYDPSKEKKLNGCGIPYCNGVGNYKRSEIETHTTLEECPYELSNWSSTNDLLNRPNRVERKLRTFAQPNASSGGRIRANRNPALNPTQTHLSLQQALNPIELASMSPKQIEAFRRLQVTANFILKNLDTLNDLREHWINRMEPLRSVEISASLRNPLNWSVDQVAKFVSDLPNCSMVGDVFIQHDIDGTALLSLRQSDMTDIMGLSLGTAIKVFNKILFLREECNAHYIQYG